MVGGLSNSNIQGTVDRTRKPPFLSLPTFVYTPSPDGNKGHKNVLVFLDPRTSRRRYILLPDSSTTPRCIPSCSEARQHIQRTNTDYAHHSLFGAQAKRDSFAAEGWASAMWMGFPATTKKSTQKSKFEYRGCDYRSFFPNNTDSRQAYCCCCSYRVERALHLSPILNSSQLCALSGTWACDPALAIAGFD